MEKNTFNFIRSLKEFQKSESFQLYRKLRNSRLILYTLRYNFISLKRSFKKFHLRESDPKFWNNLTPHLRWNTQKRISTDILNYLSSVGSIIDISRNFARKNFSLVELKEYEQIVTSDFIKNVEFKVIKNLRNYILHYSYLDVGVLSKWDQETGKSKNIFVSPDQLLEWGGWNKKEKQFLLSKGERLDIEPIFNRYHNKFIETQNILYILVLKKFKGDMEIVTHNMEELLKKGNEVNMTNTLPFRKSTIRYLKYLLNKI